MVTETRELARTLAEITEGFENLVELSLEKRCAVIKNDGVSIRDITQRESAEASRVAALDKKRRRLFDSVAGQSGKLTLNGLIEELATHSATEDDVLSELSKTGEELIRAARTLKTANERNRALLNAAIEYTDFMFNAIHGTRAPESLHALRAVDRAPEGQGAVFFDARQ